MRITTVTLFAVLMLVGSASVGQTTPAAPPIKTAQPDVYPARRAAIAAIVDRVESQPARDDGVCG